MRDYGRKIVHNKWSYRRKAAKKFRLRTYHRRELIESGNSSLKRKFGVSVSSKQSKTINAEVMSRLIYHNLFGLDFETQDRATLISLILKTLKPINILTLIKKIYLIM